MIHRKILILLVSIVTISSETLITPEKALQVSLNIENNAIRNYNPYIKQRIFSFYDKYIQTFGDNATNAEEEMYLTIFIEKLNLILKHTMTVSDNYMSLWVDYTGPSKKKIPDFTMNVEIIHQEFKAVSDFSLLNVYFTRRRDDKSKCSMFKAYKELTVDLYDILVHTEIESLILQLYSFQCDDLHTTTLEENKAETVKEFKNRIAPTRRFVELNLEAADEKITKVCHTEKSLRKI